MSNGQGPDSAIRGTRRTALYALALLCTTVAVGLVLQRRHYPYGAAILVSVVGGLPSLYLAYAAYRDGRRADAATAGRFTLAELADQFAMAVRRQWQDEAALRRLNDPYPLPVRWVAAEPSLVDDWATLLTLANTGAGWPRNADRWASGPGDLAGQGGELADVLERVPTGRLVVLGEPGAGKTMLMMRLVLDLLTRRTTGDPVPVLVSAASWDPTTQGLREWLANELITSNTALAALTHVDGIAASRITALLEEGFVMPILDGLDEIPAAVRGPAIAGINDAVRAGERLVVTCRTTPYRDAVRPADGPAVTLRGAASVALCPLDADTVASYLAADAGGPSGAPRWASVTTGLETNAALAQTLSNPLMVGLARVIYNPRPGEVSGVVPEPTQLCAYTDQAALENHLFGAYIPAAFRSPLSSSGRGKHWTPANAERWLTNLADHLENTIRTPDLAWWQLARSSAITATGVAIGMFTGLLVILAVELAFTVAVAVIGAFHLEWMAIPSVGMAARTGLKLSLLGGAGAGILAGAVAAFADKSTPRETLLSQRTRRTTGTDVALAMTSGLVAAVACWIWFQHWLTIVIGVVAASAVAFSTRRARQQGKALELRRGSAAGIVVGAVVGLTFGSFNGVIQGYKEGIRWGITWGLLAGLTAAAGTIIKASGNQRPSQAVRWNARNGTATAVMVGAAAAVVTGLAGGSAFGLPFSFIFGLTFGIAGGAVGGLQRVPDPLSTGASPRDTLAADRTATLLLAVATGVAAGVVVGVVAASLYGASGRFTAQSGLSYGLGMGISAALTVGAVFGIGVSGFGSAWPSWLTARVWLALRGRIPFRLMTFLDNAHERGVLRQSGAVYQFRHIELQRYLADRQKTSGSPANMETTTQF